MSNARIAVHGVSIFLCILVPSVAYFASIKKINEEWTKHLAARDASRGKYASSTTSQVNWPADGVDLTNASQRAKDGDADRKQDAAAFEQTKKQREVDLAAKKVELAKHKAALDALINRYMKGINRAKFNYERPDDFMYELLYRQRDEAGPRLIRFVHKTYPNLFFEFDANVPAPPINLTKGTLPPPGPEGRLDWPLGRGTFSMTVFGLLPELLRFIETFPEKYDRIAQITDFTLTREAFDHRGTVLMRLNTSIRLFVWPENAQPPAPPPAAAAPAAGPGPAGGEAPPEGGDGGGGGGGGGGDE